MASKPAPAPDQTTHPKALRCALALLLWALIVLAAVVWWRALSCAMMRALARPGSRFLLQGLATGAAGLLSIWDARDMLRLPLPIPCIGRGGLRNQRMSKALRPRGGASLAKCHPVGGARQT